MAVSKRQYYCCFLFSMVVTSVLLIIGALVANHCMYHIEMIDKICIAIAIILCAIICGSFAVILLINKGIRNTINKYILISSIEENLKSIGAYKKIENKNYIVLPKIKIKNGTIKIILKDLRMRAE